MRLFIEYTHEDDNGVEHNLSAEVIAHEYADGEWEMHLHGDAKILFQDDLEYDIQGHKVDAEMFRDVVKAEYAHQERCLDEDHADAKGDCDRYGR